MSRPYRASILFVLTQGVAPFGRFALGWYLQGFVFFGLGTQGDAPSGRFALGWYTTPLPS
jgi:hypothetical protein